MQYQIIYLYQNFVEYNKCSFGLNLQFSLWKEIPHVKGLFLNRWK